MGICLEECPACPSPRRWDQAKQLHKQDTSTPYPCQNSLAFPAVGRLGSRGAACWGTGKSQVWDLTWLLQGHSMAAARGEDKWGINMGKRQKQEQTFPPQLGSTELCLSHSLGRNSTVPCRQRDGDRPRCPRAAWGRSPKAGEEQSWMWSTGGAAPPKPGVRNRLPEETQMGSAVTGVSTAPLLLVAPRAWQRSHLPALEGSSGMSSVGLEQDIPVLEHSPAHAPAHRWGSSAGHAGDTQLSPKPEPSRGTKE